MNRLLNWGVIGGTLPADVVFPPGTVVSAAAAGGDVGDRSLDYLGAPNYYDLALTSTGSVFAWGSNLGEQLATGSTASDVLDPTPVLLPPGTTAAGISAGTDHSLVVTGPPSLPGGIPAGQVLEWGLLEAFQFHPYVPVPMPVALPPGTAASAVAAGRAFSVALTTDGTVVAWGKVEAGVFDTVYGRRPHPMNATPTRVPLPEAVRVTAVAAGDAHALALTSTGEVWGWGDNRCGVLGTASADGAQPVRVPLPAGTVVTGIAAGRNHDLAVTSTGSVLAWGCGYDAQLGGGQNPTWMFESFPPAPVLLPPGTEVTAVAAAQDHSLARTSTGDVLAWGTNYAGQIGDGNVQYFSPATKIPTPARTGLPVAGIAAGGGQSLAWTAPRTATYTGRAATAYLQGVTILQGTALKGRLPQQSQGLCEASVYSADPGGTTVGEGQPACNVGVGGPDGSGWPLLSAGVTTAAVTTTSEGDRREAIGESRLTSLTLLPKLGPGGSDVLDASDLESRSLAACAGGARGAPSSRSSIGRLTVAGTTVATQPVGGRLVFDPTGRDRLVAYGNPVAVNPTGGRIPAAIVTFNHSRYDPATNTQESSPIEVEFPPGGPLSSVITGRVFLAYTSSGVDGC